MKTKKILIIFLSILTNVFFAKSCLALDYDDFPGRPRKCESPIITRLSPVEFLFGCNSRSSHSLIFDNKAIRASQPTKAATPGPHSDTKTRKE